ncbi:hypothetical protein BGZ80_011600 [Entomortierella chlamydospora]|uniref:Arm-like repeat domain-containing protein n=1 Tax=Entomortierella chlamydospora TaxID=101097 RepID=A0A9P6SZH4_9FUNG|nr:hypothetical protein BGZ80_011600 [Entomortierella chlamydospora]
MIRNPFSSSASKLSLEDVLELANKYIENARKDSDPKEALEHSNNAKALMKDAEKIFATKKVKDSILSKDIANAYHEHGKLLDELGHHDKAQKSHAKAEKWGHVNVVSQHAGPSQSTEMNASICRLLVSAASFSAAPGVAAIMRLGISGATDLNHQQNPRGVVRTVVDNGIPAPNEDSERIRQCHFEWDVTPPAAKYDLQEAGGRISSTPQLAYCLALINPSFASKEGLDQKECDWIQAMANEPDEQKRLQTMATDLVRAFVRDKLKKHVTVAEVVTLAAVLEQEDFRKLLQAFIDCVNQSVLLEIHLLDGLSQLIRNAPQGYMDADDLVKILELLNVRLKDTHKQSIQNTYKLSQTISQVLDSMVDSQVEGLSREQLHEPLSDYLEKLQKSSDPFLIYRAAYAYQALLYVPDDESILQSMMRRTGKVVQGISGVVSAVKALDLVGFIDGLQNIQKGLTGARKVMELVRNTQEDIQALAESGQGLVESLKEDFSFNRESSWYPALRGLDKLHQEGRFTEFEKLFQDAPCQQNPAFQLGSCLGLQDPQMRNLIHGGFYNNDASWGCPTYIKQWILSHLNLLTQSLQDVIANDAQKHLHELEANGVADKTAPHEAEKYHAVLCSVMLTPPSQESPLLNRVQDKADVETPLRQLKRERLKDRGRDVYISPRAKANPRATDDFDLTSMVQEFLESKGTVFLILGDSGAGKSTFNKALEINLRDKYETGGIIPLFIHLPTLSNPERDLIAERLRQANFTESQILELKLHRKFILICDGYDEIQNTKNLYMSNPLNQPGEWCAQMLISCRTEYSGVDYKDCFQPTERNSGGYNEQFQEACIMPFNKDQIQDYIDQYVFIRGSAWRSEDYQKAFKQIPNLEDLVKNPFLLKRSLEVLPRMFNSKSDFSIARITRVRLYDEFVAQWIERGKARLREMELSSRDQETFRRMTISGFRQLGITYMKELVEAIYDNQSGNPVVNYSEYHDRRTWKKEFFSDIEGRHLLGEAIPLARNGDRYRFIHKSVLEYGLALAIYDPNNHNVDTEAVEAVPTISRRGSDSSILSFEKSPTGNTTDIDDKSLLESPLGKENLVGQQYILQFMAERVKQQPVFKGQLHSIIERSKTDKSVRIAAANAITILVRAGVQFNHADLRNIKIPGADLSFGVFDSEQLERADLRKTNLRNIWMRQANLRGAQMTGVQFGELPFLEEDSDVHCCAYSPDGATFAAGLSGGNISLYRTLDWDRIRTLRGHSGCVNDLSFSATGDHIVSGSNDNTIQVWSVETGNCIRTLLGHTDEGHDGCVCSVTFSPNGDQIASGSDDKTVRLWSADTGGCVHILVGQNGGIFSVAYSPKGDQIASGSGDSTVRLWDVDTGECLSTFLGHSGDIYCVAYSPKRDWIASGSNDETVRLCDVATCEYISTSQRHRDNVNSVAFSPKGDQVASGSGDRTIRLWDVDTGDCVRILRGHTNRVTSVSYSPDGNRVVSGSYDWTVRLWDIDTGECLNIFHGHGDCVRCSACSSKRGWVASGGDDSTIRLLDVETGATLKALQGHNDYVRGIAISPKGDRIASGSDDNTVRLWDVDTTNCLHTLLDHSGWVWSVAYSPNGDLIASGSGDETVRLWNADTGDCIHILRGHTGSVYSVAFSPKGDQIASGSSDGTFRV